MPTNINFNKKLGLKGGSLITLPTSSTPSFSNVNSFSFDGVDDYFLGTSTYSELNGANKATFSFWIKPQDNGLRILLHVPINYTNAHGQFLIYQRNGRIQMNIDSSSYYCLTPDNTLILNEWQHVMICMDLPSLDEGKIFINGVDKTNLENWYNRTALSPSIGGLYIGEANNGYLSPFYGNLDEVAIWSGTDLRNDVATIYNNGTPTDLNNNGLTAPTTWQRMGENATWNGLTWTMTDVNGSYTNRAANMVEANRTTDVPSASSFTNTKSILLDGVDDYVTMGNVLNQPNDGSDAFSISCWYKTTNSGSQMFVAKQNNSGSFNGFSLSMEPNNKLSFFIGTVSGSQYLYVQSANSSVHSNGNWHHLLLTYDGSQNTSGINMYFDGSSLSLTSVQNVAPSGVQSSVPFLLGARGLTFSNRLNGNLDEVSIYDSAINISDVWDGSGVPFDISSTNPLSWWRCGDGDTAPILTDNGSASNDGTMTNFSTFSTDVPFNYKSILLDGVDDYINVADNNNLSFGNGTTDSPFSISAWVKMTDATRFRIVFKADNTTGNNEYGFFCDASDRINFVLYDSKSNVSRGRYYNVGLSSYQGQWINLVATYDGQGGTSAQNGIKIYLNGTQVDNVDVSTGTYTAMHNGNAPLEIGKFLTNRSNGLMDEIAIFNVELSASDVTSIYGGGTPSSLSSYSSLVSWWRFEGSGTTATDSGSGGNDGTLINGVTRSTDVPT